MAITVSEGLDVVTGSVALRFTNPGPDLLDHIDLWTFPERLRRPPPELRETDLPRMFPRAFDPGGMDVLSVATSGIGLRWTRVSHALVRIELPEPLAAGAAADVDVGFRTKVPARYGPFGHAAGQLTLDGGFFPSPPPFEAGDFASDAPPAPISWTLRLRWDGDEESVLVANGATRVVAPGEAVEVSGRPADRVSVVFGPGMIRDEFSGPWGEVVLLRRTPRPRSGGRGDLDDLGRLDRHRETLATVAHGVSWLDRRNVPRSRPLPLLVEAPLRREVALAAPDMVLVSDRAFAVTPFERLLKFHRLPLLRALFAATVGERAALREPGRRSEIVRDLVASALAMQWEAARYKRQEAVTDVLEPADFLSDVDDVLRAQETPFHSAYFRGSDDTDPYRDRFSMFSHRGPAGRLWLEKLRDAAGDRRAFAVVEAMIRDGLDLTGALAREAPESDVRYLAQWENGSPAVDYRVGAVSARRDPSGPYAEIEVLRTGGEGLREAVGIAVSGADPVTALVDEPTEVVRVSTADPTPSVVLDPAGRLVQSDLGRNVDPRFDDATDHPWRPLLDGVGFEASSATGRIDVAVSGFARRDHDLGHVLVWEIGDSERSLGGALSWVHGFGEKVSRSRRRYGLGLAAGGSWLKPVLGDPGGFGAGLGISLADVPWESTSEPREGAFRVVALGPTVAVREGETHLVFVSGLRTIRVLDLGHGHVLSGHLRVSDLWGDAGRGGRLGVGGLGAVRALGTFASDGLHRVVASLEWRHVWTRDLPFDAAHLAWLETLEGVFFVDGALLADDLPDLALDPAARSLGVGYGLRFHWLAGGLSPVILSVDAGVPVLHEGRPGGGAGPPFTILATVGRSL